MNIKTKKFIYDNIKTIKNENKRRTKDKIKSIKKYANEIETFINKNINKAKIKGYEELKYTYTVIIEFYLKSDILQTYSNLINDNNIGNGIIEEMNKRGYKRLKIDYHLKLITFDVIK